MKIVIAFIALGVIFGQGLLAQTEYIQKPENGQTSYTINADSGVVNLFATDSIRILPNTIIEAGSIFTARILGNPENEFSVVINTANLPNSQFEVIAGATVINNLESGNQDSEVTVETGPDTGEGNYVLINVEPTANKKALNLRISKSQEVFQVEVFQQGLWKKLSSEFYQVVDDKIVFFSGGTPKNQPFNMNLVNGVEYNRAASLTLSIDETISISGGSLQITGPNDFSTTISPDITNNNFTWDGTQATPGVYKFQLQLQGKLFNGQFLIL